MKNYNYYFCFLFCCLLICGLNSCKSKSKRDHVIKIVPKEENKPIPPEVLPYIDVPIPEIPKDEPKPSIVVPEKPDKVAPMQEIDPSKHPGRRNNPDTYTPEMRYEDK